MHSPDAKLSGTFNMVSLWIYLVISNHKHDTLRIHLNVMRWTALIVLLRLLECCHMVLKITVLSLTWYFNSYYILLCYIWVLYRNLFCFSNREQKGMDTYGRRCKEELAETGKMWSGYSMWEKYLISVKREKSNQSF